MARNAILAPVSLVLLAGSILLLFFLILPGVANSTPLNQTYFLRADTSGIQGARPITQWTYFYVCSPGNRDCSGPRPAPGLGWAWDSDADNAPSKLVGADGGSVTKYYYLMWRFGWVFFLITLFFTVVAFFSAFVACCGRLGAALSGLASVVALFFHTIAVSLMTAVFVKMRNGFQADGRSATLGKYAFGFAWGSWAALFIATVLLCLGTRKEKDVVTSKSGRRWGRRQRSVRSRRSYDMGGRRVKEDYA